MRHNKESLQNTIRLINIKDFPDASSEVRSSRYGWAIEIVNELRTRIGKKEFPHFRDFLEELSRYDESLVWYLNRESENVSAADLLAKFGDRVIVEAAKNYFSPQPTRKARTTLVSALRPLASYLETLYPGVGHSLLWNTYVGRVQQGLEGEFMAQVTRGNDIVRQKRLDALATKVTDVVSEMSSQLHGRDAAEIVAQHPTFWNLVPTPKDLSLRAIVAANLASRSTGPNSAHSLAIEHLSHRQASLYFGI